ncbi:predicted protein [Naegleria gruberi]|uniref:Predicted protein n=1 Tax=Naegleria gruberi TaxID=5762 RepID=D2W5D1_NAEGR|nr:uncharacterized protein NAEGRDRAFT_76621 [Naegleria gruberi]EFC35721.1 predicted protein [Naegleria gruberi]|eukprot:XP_002668465.1 predicted protein [Naegleria gruberi strain NEG-M]
MLLQKFPYLIPLSKIGKGAQGIVFKCFHTQLEQIVVLKVNITPEEQPERTEKLFNFMKTPNLKGIVRTFECNFYELHNSKYSYLIMEMGSPLDHVMSEMHQNYSNLEHCLSTQDLIEVLQYFTEVLEGVISLHNLNFTHRDLKLANVIINNEGHAKLIDFDNSKVIQSNHSITVNIGTWEYLAPEVYDEEEGKQTENFKISKNCDTYSMGCVLMKMICNRTLSIISTNEDSGSSCLFGVGKNYFFKLLSTPQGEAMLHQSIRKEIDKFIDPNLEVICSHPNSFLEKVLFNDILGRCLITMIQSRSTHRGRMYSLSQNYE